MESSENKKQIALAKYIHAEVVRINEAKWYRGISLQCDPGQEFIKDWISENAAKFRLQWEDSKCKDCKNWKVCAHKVLKECKEFILDQGE